MADTLITYRGVGLLIGLAFIALFAIIKWKKPKLLQMLGLVSFGRLFLDATVFGGYYITGNWWLGASINDLSDSLIILVVWVIYTGWTEYEKNNKTSHREKPRNER